MDPVRSLLSPELAASLPEEAAVPPHSSPAARRSRKPPPKQRTVSKSAVKREEEKKRKRVERIKGEHGRAAEAQALIARIAASSLGDAAASLVSSRQLVRRDRRARKLPKTPKTQGEEQEQEQEEEEEEEQQEDLTVLADQHLEHSVGDGDEMLDGELVGATALAVPEAVSAVVATRADPPLSPAPALPRPADVARARMELPVQQHEADVMDSLSGSDVVVVVAPTGSGKTTQLPQWLLEYGYRALGMVAVTQPRKLACRMVSARIAHETGLEWGSQVGYHTRHDRHYAHWDTCQVLLCTDGLLLAAARSDPLLERYSVVVVDEAHERTLHTDVLLGLLSRVVALRRRHWQQGGEAPPLKVVVMSATLDVEPLTQLFSPAPRVVKLEGRQFPVTTHHLLKTPHDVSGALEAAVKAVGRIVSTLPNGCILVFAPGKREIAWIIDALHLQLAHVAEPVRLLPLYAGQTHADQQLPFDAAPEGGWKVVVATNVAECSLTIPDVRYVVDTGYARSRLHDGVFVTEPCSQASANQRTGRAGRTREGHCYRMYSSAFFTHHMAPHDVPHSLRVASEELLMQLLALGVSRPATFPLPSAPPSATLHAAAARLHAWGFLTSAAMPLRLTLLGSRAMTLPVSPAQARFLLTAANVRLACIVCGVWAAHQVADSAADDGAPGTQLPSWWRKARASCDVFAPVSALLLAGAAPVSPALQSARMLASQLMALLGGDPDEPLPDSVVPLQQSLLGANPWTLCRRDGDHYVCLLDDQHVYLHPQHCSREFASARHPWISCLSFLTLAERRYAVFPFQVLPQWLLDVLPGALLVDYSRVDAASAQYDPAVGAVTVECSPRYGPLLAALPVQRVVLRDSAVFAQMLLAGQVAAELRPLVASLRLDPSSLSTPPFPDACVALRSAMDGIWTLEQLRSSRAAPRIVDAAQVFYVSAARAAARKAWSKLCEK